MYRIACFYLKPAVEEFLLRRLTAWDAGLIAKLKSD